MVFVVPKLEDLEHGSQSQPFELAGFKQFQHLELHRLGFRKGSCPVTNERIEIAREAALEMISRSKVLGAGVAVERQLPACF
jgi:hypothetical protein